LVGQHEAALAVADALPADERPYELARIYAAMARYGEAADVLLTLPEGRFNPDTLEAAASILRAAPAVPEDASLLPFFLDWVYIYTGSPAFLESRGEGIDEGEFRLPIPVLWDSSNSPVRQTERFKNFVRNLGYVDYWRGRGWPEYCHPTEGDNFDCE
jgi:hypothetical protein